MEWTWAEVTREERFFTATLYHDIKNNPAPLSKLFQQKLTSLIQPDAYIVDYGFEVCFFRDLVKAGKISLQYNEGQKKPLEKQTFDLVFTLSDNSLIIIEAKAQQSFSSKQLNQLSESRNIILNISDWKYQPIYLGALYSSIYRQKDTTLGYFDIKITWNEIVEMYPNNKEI